MGGKCPVAGTSPLTPRQAPAPSPQTAQVVPGGAQRPAAAQAPTLDRNDPYVQQALSEARRRAAEGGFKGKGVKAMLEWTDARRGELMAEGQIRIQKEQGEAQVKAQKAQVELGERQKDVAEIEAEGAAAGADPAKIAGVVRRYLSGKDDRQIDWDRAKAAFKGGGGDKGAWTEARATQEVLDATRGAWDGTEDAKKIAALTNIGPEALRLARPHVGEPVQRFIDRVLGGGATDTRPPALELGDANVPYTPEAAPSGSVQAQNPEMAREAALRADPRVQKAQAELNALPPEQQTPEAAAAILKKYGIG